MERCTLATLTRPEDRWTSVDLDKLGERPRPLAIAVATVSIEVVTQPARPGVWWHAWPPISVRPGVGAQARA